MYNALEACSEQTPGAIWRTYVCCGMTPENYPALKKPLNSK
jgi:hypothetical protein